MSNASLEALLGKEHPEIKYLKSDQISLVLSRALSETYKHQPNDPVAFFSRYLLNHCNVQKKHHDNYQRASEIKVAREEHVAVKAKEMEEVKEKEKVAVKEEETKQSFYKEIEEASDLTDNLQNLTDFLSEHTKSTGVYIAKLVHPSKPIQDDSDDKAHIDEEAPKVLKYIHTTEDHDFMIGRTLGPDQGISHDVFKEGSAGGEGEGEPEGEEGDPASPKQEEDILKTFKGVVYVNEVVREPRMNYQKVPRLGCYMAVPLVYNSCLSDEALDAAVADTQERMTKQAEQDQEKEAWDQEQQSKRESAEADQQPFEEEEREWPEIPAAPLVTHEVKYVICMDTLGQDRQFDDDTKRFVLQTVKAFQKAWEASDRRALEADRDLKMEQLGLDQTAEQEAQQALADDVEKEVQETVETWGERELDEEQKELESQQLRLQIQARQLCDKPECQKMIEDICKQRVLKMPRILQALMYLLGFSREVICEKDTNLFDWKRSLKLFSEQCNASMQKYQVLGAKQEDFRAFNQLTFVESLLAGNNQEEVDAYNPGFGRLFKWLTTAIATRKADITRRHALTKKAREDRQTKIAESEARDQQKNERLAEEEEKFKSDNKEAIDAYDKWMEDKAQRESKEYGEEMDEEDEARMNAGPPELPKFDTEEALARFDEEVPVIVIPDEVVDDVDNDWPLDEDAMAEVIATYWAQREA